MKITMKLLRESYACPEGIAWFLANPGLEDADSAVVCNTLESVGHRNWAIWVRLVVSSALLERRLQ